MPTPRARYRSIRSIRNTFGLALVAAVLACSHDAVEYAAERTAAVPAAGARVIRITSGAGLLHINGTTGSDEVRVQGVARAHSRRALDRIRFVAERLGDTIVIRGVVRDVARRGPLEIFRGSRSLLDFTIDVPPDIELDVTDGSGEIRVRGVGSLSLVDGSGEIDIVGLTGNLMLHDGSGNVSISAVDGDVRLRDGSGNVVARNVTGDFTVEEDGSGNLDLDGIGGTVRVVRDGPGTLDVNRVGGDLVVEAKRRGSINSSNVQGRTDIPERRTRDR